MVTSRHQHGVDAAYTSPATRAKWVRLHFLGAPLPNGFPGAEPVKPELPITPQTRTLAVNPCVNCHRDFFPIGYALENFDPLGRWRTLDNGLPVDPSVSVDFLDEGPFTAATPVDALKGFTNSMRFKQCFVRQMFRFYTGRDETAADDPVLRQMFFGFADKDEQAVVQLLRVLATSTSFAQRTETP